MEEPQSTAPEPSGPASVRSGRVRGRLCEWLLRWREDHLVRRALKLAGDPGLVLDLPCGGGRFLAVLAEQPNRVILAADQSDETLAAALAGCSADLLRRIHPLRTSVFAIDLPDNAVDSILCMRVLRCCTDRQQRLAMLREFHRVTRDTLSVSLWMDGGYEAWRCKRARRGALPPSASLFGRAATEAEFAEVGFSIVAHQSFLPGYAMERVYVLRKKD